uniref:Insulin-like growth factor-binding protein 1 n=1 Tax=Salarias fasciatus TaxID=181472 RepID=A0A672FIR0_SALFA
MAGLSVRHVVAPLLVCSVLVTGTLGSPVVGPEPIRCAACSPEKVSQCPAVAPGCAEVLREPGCGCCLACALKAGEPCGIYTAPCGSGLRCSPRPGDPRPLHSLTRGQAMCTESAEPEPTPETQTGATESAFSVIQPDAHVPGADPSAVPPVSRDPATWSYAEHSSSLQCESSLDGQRGRCWCVNSWNGKKILGSTDLPADADLIYFNFIAFYLFFVIMS